MAWLGFVAGAAALIASATAVAATPIAEPEELERLCGLGSATIDTDDPEEHAEYHQARRSAVYEIYETPLPNLDPGLLGYDRVTGVLTISGFRTYRPQNEGPSVRIRNECIIGFEFDEEQANDLIAQFRMGTVEVRIGYQVAARSDYETDFCPAEDGKDDEDASHLKVDLLYAQLVDRERGGDSGEVIDTFYTQLGHRLSLRRSTSIIDQARQSVPEVEVSSMQWRPQGQGWGEAVEADDVSEGLDKREAHLRPLIERALYPCYVRALGANASLQGALVLEIPLGDTEEPSPGFLMDTLRTQGLRGCVEQRLRGIDGLTAAGTDEGVDALKTTILMRRR